MRGPSSRAPLTPFEWWFSALFLAIIVGAFVAVIVQDYEPIKLLDRLVVLHNDRDEGADNDGEEERAEPLFEGRQRRSRARAAHAKLPCGAGLRFCLELGRIGILP